MTVIICKGTITLPGDSKGNLDKLDMAGTRWAIVLGRLFSPVANSCWTVADLAVGHCPL